ncbi:MAG: hypothetical protein N4A47_00170 [Clostridia bacterium]|nr:hypothetical protein [Clostridia bacterium]
MKEIVFEVLIGAVILGLLLMAIALFRDSMGFIRGASETIVDTGKVKTNSLVDVEDVDAEVKGSDIRGILKYMLEGHMSKVEIEIDGSVYSYAADSGRIGDVLDDYDDYDFLDKTFTQSRQEDADGDVERYIFIPIN